MSESNASFCLRFISFRRMILPFLLDFLLSSFDHMEDLCVLSDNVNTVFPISVRRGALSGSLRSLGFFSLQTTRPPALPLFARGLDQ